MHIALLAAVTLLCVITGALLVFFPATARRIEIALNRTWGDRELFGLRLRLPGEQRAETWLNQPLDGGSIRWDGWVRSHPRASGLLLWGIAGLLVLFAAP